jgi:ABC-type multidrug transport system fused ATPase/permease subunit
MKNNTHFSAVRETLAYFIPIVFCHYKGFFLCSVINIILCAIQPFISIMITPIILDELLGSRSFETLLAYAAVLVLGTTTLSIAISLTSSIMEKYNLKMENYFTEEISTRVMEMDFQLTEDKKALDQLEAARTGMSWYSGGVYGISLQVFSIIQNVLKITGVVALLLLHAPVLFVVSIVIIVFSSSLNNHKNRIEIASFRKLSRLNRVFGYLSWELVDFRYGKDIRLYDAKDMMITKWNAYSDECLNQWKWMVNREIPLDLLKTFCDAAKHFCTYMYLGILVISGKITIGVFSQMLSVSSTFHNAMQGLITNIQELVKRTGYAYDYVKFMHYPPAIKKGTRPVLDQPHTIEFRNVSFIYPNSDKKVLDHVNLTLHPGEHLSIVGLNGAGKTTFIKLLCRLYDTTDGEILLDNVDIREYDYNEYISLFSPVFQDFKLFGFSLRENFVLDHDCTEQNFLALLAQIGLKQNADTILFKFFDEHGLEPSGGEQQKIAIARALFKRAPVVILDEPTAALDPFAEYDIYRHFNTLIGNKTAVYISHRLSSCKFCDRIAVFSEGCVKEYGTHEELVKKTGGIYAELFNAQAQYYNN